MVGPRLCPRCQNENDSSSGAYCKACRSKYMRERYAQNPEAHRQRSKTWRENNPAKKVESDRRQQLRKMGVTLEWFQEKLKKQRNRCAICRKPAGSDGRQNLGIDHDHTCCSVNSTCEKCRRGLLCVNCNLMIGSAFDNPKILEAAAEYLRTYKRKR